MSNPLEDVDAKIAWNNPSSPVLGYFLWAVTLFFWAVGGSVVVQLILGASETSGEAIGFLSSLLGEYYRVIVPAVLYLALVLILAISVTLALMKKIARYVLYFIVITSVVLFIGVSAVAFASKQYFVGAAMLIPGVILLLIIALKWERIKLAGRAMELSAAAITDEKGTVLAAFLNSILTGWTAISGILSILVIYALLDARFPNSSLPETVAFILVFLLLWVTMFQTYFFDGVIASIVHAWYRSPEVDVASFSQGFRRAWYVQGGLAIYAFAMSILRLAISEARRREGIAMRLVAAILRIAESLVEFLTYYIVPAIVVRKTSFKDGLRDSVHKLRDLFIETLIGNFSFGLVLAFFGGVYTIILGALGYLIGAYVLPIFEPSIATYAGTVGVINAIVYILVGIIPLSLVFRALSVAFKTILYEFGIDIEMALKGETLPSRLPEDIKRDFVEVLVDAGAPIKPEVILS